jgi:hypothetical protein
VRPAGATAFLSTESWQMKNRLILLAIIVMIAGCAGWKAVDGGIHSETYRVEVPNGWMKYDAGAYVMISRDGPYLQYVLFQERPLERPFLNARKRLTADMLPQEAAQIIIDDLSSDPMVANFTVIENVPAVIDDHDGFRLLFRYSDPKGLTLKTAYYGFIQGQIYYSLRFTAPQRYYFDNDIDVFESMLSKFHLVAAR